MLTVAVRETTMKTRCEMRRDAPAADQVGLIDGILPRRHGLKAKGRERPRRDW